MAKIIAFGCSFTHGQCLPDQEEKHWANQRHYTYLIPPSAYAWPAQLGRLTKSRVINLSDPGLSNKHIMHRVLTTDQIEPEDHVIIMWSNPHRGTALRANEQHHDMHPNMNTKHGRWFYKLYENYDLEFMDYVYQYTADRYLRDRGCTVTHTNMTIIVKDVVRPQWFDIEYQEPWHEVSDYAVDGEHPGVESHRLYAERLYRKIFQS